jgi:hypothetical protein
MRAATPIATTILLAATIASVVGVLGNMIPSHWQGYVPMLVNNDFMRDELVRINAMADDSAPCVALFGDSRMAFNVSGSRIDDKLPAGCRSQNYGFPALKLAQISELAGQLRDKRLIVLSISETLLLTRSSMGDRARIDYGRWIEDQARQYLLSRRWIRDVYLGQHRLAQYAREKLGMSFATDNVGWEWSGKQKRWIYQGSGNRQLVSIPTHYAESKDIAESYFDCSCTPNESALSAVLLELSRNFRLIVVIPPSEASFQRFAEELAPGVQPEVWAAVRRAARDHEVRLVDCSKAELCGVQQTGFADPVHLNEEGIKAYSTFLSAVIATEALRLSFRPS